MKDTQDHTVPYRVLRSRRSTADIIIDRDGSVLIRAPEWVDDGKIQNIIESRQLWIYQSLAEWRDLNATRVVREYKNGESFLYLGRTYRLLLVTEQDEPLQLKSGRFMLRRELVKNNDNSAAKAAFQDYYTACGLDRIPQRIAYYAPKVGMEPTGAEIRELGYRWASCSPTGELAFHWKCMMAPQTIIDYIVVHELCHLYHHNHTEAFWNEVDKVIPEYRERKEWLRKNGAGLDI